MHDLLNRESQAEKETISSMIVAAKVRNAARAVDRKAVAIYMNQEKHDNANRLAANVILADPERYDGALLMWAKAWTERVSK